MRIPSDRCIGTAGVPSPRLRSALACFALFTGIVVILQILKLPQNLDYAAFAFGEPGSNLNVAYLVQHGLRPAVDFGHPYGLLEVLVLDLWFRLARLTPLAYLELIFLLQVLMAAVLAEFVVVAELPWFRILFMVAALPVFLWVNYFRAAHAIETVCLLAAITAHLKGRYDVALAATAAAVLARPALGYVYGAFLVSVGGDQDRAWRAEVIGVAIAFFLYCGPAAVADMAVRSYSSASNHISGRWHGQLSHSGLWVFWARNGLLAALALYDSPLLRCARLLAAGSGYGNGAGASRVAASGRYRRYTPAKSRDCMCFRALVFVWIFFAFSHQYIGGWILYLFFPVIGVSLLGDFFPRFGVVLGLMVLIALNADRHDIASSVDAWRTAHRSHCSRQIVLR